MTDLRDLDHVLAAADRRRAERRGFLRAAGAASTTVAGASLLAACSSGDDDGDLIVVPAPTTPSPSPPSASGDADVLNFALNLEYLEAQFYAVAANGVGLPASLTGGTGTAGVATGGRQVVFTDPVVRAYAREIAADEQAHVAFIRRALGAAAVAQPAIDLAATPASAFSAAARAAGLVGANEAFDPYASDENFLLGAFLFEDVGVSAYKGAATLLTRTFLEATAGILAAEAYHAGLVRTTLYRKGIDARALVDATEAISAARDRLDGASADRDEGVLPRLNATNIVPADQYAIAFGRTPGQVLNIVYLTASAATAGGFFPAGVNGAVRTSAASA